MGEMRAAPEDVFHIHLPNPGAVLAYLAIRRCGPLVVTYHSDTVRHPCLGAIFRPFLEAFLRRSAAIIATSPDYIQSSPVLPRHVHRCHVIPLGIRVENFESCPAEGVSAIRQQYGERLILSVGRLVYYKGYEYLIRAMRHIRGTLLIVGVGPLRPSLEALSFQGGVSDRVHFLGAVPAHILVACYHAASIFVLPSVHRSEAFGLVQVEAMAAGLPVVNTRLDSGVPFVSRHGETGITVPHSDPDTLAQAVNLLLDNPDRRRAYGAAARKRATEEFSATRMAARTLALYNAVLRSFPGSKSSVGQPQASAASREFQNRFMEGL
jgi:rhamnosyl/mannosyltransferase